MAVDVFHFSLQLRFFFLGDGWLVVVVIVEKHGEGVGHGLALRVAHRIDGGVGALGHELVLQPIAAAVASDDATNLPESDVVKELTTWDANLAHEQLINVAGGCQFFALPFPFDGFSSGSPAGTA